jgi:hypothetical protein
MISKKKLTMQGHRNIKEQLPKHNHIITGGTDNRDGHVHYLELVTREEFSPYPEARIWLSELFFAEKMN